MCTVQPLRTSERALIGKSEQNDHNVLSFQYVQVFNTLGLVCLALLGALAFGRLQHPRCLAYCRLVRYTIKTWGYWLHKCYAKLSQSPKRVPR
jgi:hypothetical protein